MGRFYPSVVDIQSYTATRAADGGEVKTWSDVAGLTDLPCAVSGSGGWENKRADGTIASSSHRIAIAGSYPAITPKMRAVVATVNYDILSVEHDSHANTTSLVCQRVV
jgi:head-tail adaptor